MCWGRSSVTGLGKTCLMLHVHCPMYMIIIKINCLFAFLFVFNCFFVNRSRGGHLHKRRQQTCLIYTVHGHVKTCDLINDILLLESSCPLVHLWRFYPIYNATHPSNKWACKLDAYPSDADAFQKAHRTTSRGPKGFQLEVCAPILSIVHTAFSLEIFGIKLFPSSWRPIFWCFGNSIKPFCEQVGKFVFMIGPRW